MILCQYSKRRGRTGLLQLQRHQDDITHHEELGKNNRPKTEGRDKYMRRGAVRFHAGQRDN